MNIKEFLIDDKTTMLKAMEQLDQVAKKVLFVTRNNCFVGAITDGDIRRWILKKGSLDAKVLDIANYKPKFVYQKDQNIAKEIMKKYGVEALPVLNDSGEIISIILWNSEEINEKKRLNVPVVIMAGGLGTRLYPYTKILPKPLIPIGEIPIIEHIMNRLYDNGSEKFHLIVNHKKNMIKAYFNENNNKYEVNYEDEEIPLGTGGGLSLLKGKINSTFILTNCDILIEEDYEKIFSYHKKEKNLITMVCSLKNIKIPYGVVEINELGEIDKMKEKPEISFFTNTGMYIVEPSIIDEMEHDMYIGFPDIIEGYKKKGYKIGVYPISEHAWLDMGQIDEMENMRKRLEKNE
ncbi:sugar phosphate nucleotidyltransferase [Planococcus sp. A6]|uniref:sugar phosphate nucleotidyltransferase n=1 Tax=Planococcus sp. A6 TaxID=2992760 RepID=UPI00237B76C3|nr:sugar phosphate nucleotidyltransferase [Planococcus sp. A6]MDE0582104.1 sugar phosphate nucleotidyltransferase [Planococcus sp. A6]